MLETIGGYQKPAGYKSFEERCIEQQEKILKEMAELRRRKAQAERGDEFEKMLADEDSEDHKACFSNLSTIEQSLKAMKKYRPFEDAMRREFDKLKGKQANSKPVDGIEF